MWVRVMNVIQQLVQNNNLKLDRKRIYSMAGRFQNDENTIYIQYCRSCDTHNWCTHHDESKYHDTFIKFSDIISHRLPHLEIIGNMVPSHLIPFKIAENKYIDANTNKYVVFPHIGSFEVNFRGKTIFSKKDTHNWPNLNVVASKIISIVDPNHHSPNKEELPHQQNTENNQVYNENSFTDQEEEKKTKYKTQQKGFTLTDHFKLYRPKNSFQEKDWLTQKQESQASSKHISQMVRLESRQKSNKSIDSKKSSDLVGQSKLKEMLKNKGALSKEQGKKEMIIRLDSIQEENACEQAAAATQRTQEKNVKKNRMKEIDEQINSLEDKFKNFENRVHDIQARNMEFENKNDNVEDKNRFKQIMQNKSQLSRKLSNKPEKETDPKQKTFAADKTNKLEQYLKYSQQEKNDKLHRIYGEWKLIKQFNTKNKKLLKARQKAQGQEQNDSESQETSKEDSHSPSSFANIITFKHKNEKNASSKKQKEHKYSSVQRYHKSSNKLLHPIKNNTDNNFYNSHNRLIKPKIEAQSDAQINVAPHYQPTSKLIKKSFNTLSMNALKSLANNPNLPKIQTDINSVENYSLSAKQDISKINNRISNIQQKLKYHNNSGFSPIQQSPCNQRERNYSKKSQSQSGSQNKVSFKKINNIYNPNERNSNVSTNTIKKNYSQQKMKHSNFTELARPQTKKHNQKNNQSIREENTLRQDRNDQNKPHLSKRKEAKYIQSNKENPVVRQTHNSKVYSSQSTNRFSAIAGHNKNSKSKDQPQRLLKKDSKKAFQQESHEKIINNVQPKKPLKGKKIQNASNIKRAQQSQNYQQQCSSQQEQHYKDQNYQYEPHKPRKVKPLQRKFKDWRESSPTNHILKSKQLQRKQSSNETSKQRKEQSKMSSRQKNVSQRRQIDTKQTVARNKKQKPNQKALNNKIDIINPIIEEKSNVTSVAESKKVRSGQIKKNRIIKQSIHKPQPNINKESQQSELEVEKNQEELYQQSSNPSEYNQQQYPEQQALRTTEQHEQNAQHTNEIPQKSNKKQLGKTLGYFKTSEMCYKGDEKVNSQNIMVSETSGNIKVDQNMKQQRQLNHEEVQQSSDEGSCSSQFEPQCKKQKKESTFEQKEEEKLQGWNDKSNSQQNEMVPSQTQEPLDNKMRKNSLDQQIENQSTHKEPSQPQHSYKTEADIEKQIEEGNQVTQTTKQVYSEPTPGANNQQIIEKDNLEQNIAQNQPASLDKNEPQQKSKERQQQMCQKQLPKKTKKQISKKTKQIIKKQQQLDIGIIACRQYSQFLEYKIANDLCLIELQKQKVQYEGCEYKVNLINCKSQQSIQHNNVISFMSFQPSKPVEPQQSEEVANQNNQDEGQYSQEFEEQAQQQSDKQVSKDASNNETNQIQPKNQQCIVIVQGSKNENIHPNLQQLRQQGPVHSNQHETAKGQQKVNLQQPQTIKQNKDNIQTKPKPNQKQATLNHNSSPTQTLRQEDSSQNAKVDQPLDNVYSEAKKQKTSKFAQIGVQKELTLQVSIQTDSPFQTDAVFIGRQGTIFQEERAQSKRSKNSRPITSHNNSVNEFDGTVKNSYLNSTKNKFYPEGKPKRQIFRAKITNQIASSSKDAQMAKFQLVINGNQQPIIRQEGSVAKLSQIYVQGLLINEQNLEIQTIQTKIPKYLKVLQILAERGDWILTRLFQDAKGILQQKAFGVWLCRNFQWECFIVDDKIQVDETNKPLYTYHIGNQKWANVLQKAIAKAFGGYQRFARAQTCEIFTLLTGCNTLAVKVKEDPSKNAKLLQLVSQCQRKNYIVHAQKNIDKAKHEKDRESIYYLQTVRKSNSEQQALVEISQDGRQSFWMRLSKFTQEFSKIQVLQLRVNHSFTHIDIGVGKENKITVIELNFAESGQGCVTLTYIDHAAPLFAYLYKQEKSKVLKLVGQAREKQKSHLFFECNFNEGRYYVFAQTKEKQARLCFYGQNVPALRITEEIYNDGLKNEVAEYLPIKDNNEPKPKKELEENWTDWRGKTPRLKDNFMQSRLRENFVEYILGKTKRRDAQF